MTRKKNLILEDRRHLEQLYNEGARLADIAAFLGVHLATIYRELARGKTGQLDANGREGYSADIAQKAAQENLKRRGRKISAT